MRVFRVEREKYLEATLEGSGASLNDGFRWNSLNTLMVYTSESRALATLEVAVHLNINEYLPLDRYYVEINIPDNVAIFELKIESLPEGWYSNPPIRKTQFIGDDFVRRNIAAVLKVPSSIVHQEYNYLINPQHPDSENISVVSVSPFRFDSRLSH